VLASVAILGAIVLIRRGERAVAVKTPEAVPHAVEIPASEECAREGAASRTSREADSCSKFWSC
jgi:hypothetical protein